MRERYWQTSKNSELLLTGIHTQFKLDWRDRRYQLFNAACLRWPSCQYLHSKLTLKATAIVEKRALNPRYRANPTKIERELYETYNDHGLDYDQGLFVYQAHSALYDFPAEAAEIATQSPAFPPRPVQAHILRDIFGNPFKPVQLPKSWTPPDGVSAMAQKLYDTQAYDELPILADLLDETECPDPQLATHLRSGCIHVRGCFALDYLLGKRR